MKNIDLLTLLAVFQEMLGPLLWVLAVVILVSTVTFFALLLHERRIVSRRLMWSELLGLIGGGLALALMTKVSSSSLTDAASAVDWLLIVLIFIAGAIGTTVITYTVAGWRSQLKRT